MTKKIASNTASKKGLDIASIVTPIIESATPSVVVNEVVNEVVKPVVVPQPVIPEKPKAVEMIHTVVKLYSPVIKKDKDTGKQTMIGEAYNKLYISFPASLSLRQQHAKVLYHACSAVIAQILGIKANKRANGRDLPKSVYYSFTLGGEVFNSQLLKLSANMKKTSMFNMKEFIDMTDSEVVTAVTEIFTGELAQAQKVISVLRARAINEANYLESSNINPAELLVSNFDVKALEDRFDMAILA